MALIKCKECGKEISTSAKACPSCGAPLKKRAGCGCLAVGLLAILIIGMAGTSHKQSLATSNSATPATPASP
ncbi:MAG: zinc-ribbon domain-containing protein, partial [Verrucomicrobiota bacterium]